MLLGPGKGKTKTAEPAAVGDMAACALIEQVCLIVSTMRWTGPFLAAHFAISPWIEACAVTHGIPWQNYGQIDAIRKVWLSLAWLPKVLQGFDLLSLSEWCNLQR